MQPLRGSTGDEDQDMEGREALVEGSLEELFAAFDRAGEQRVPQPVILLIDCEDEIGAHIARAWQGDDAVDAAILANADTAAPTDDCAPTTILVRAFPFEDCRREIPELFPYLAETFRARPSEDGFLVVAIAYGGAATFTAPLSARP